MENEFNMLDAIQSPLITHNISWFDCVAQRIKDLVLPARLHALKKGETLATLPEVVIYLTTRSFAAPMDSDWTDIFTWSTCKVLQDHLNEDVWNSIGARKTLTSDQERDLKGLRAWIYDKRRQILKQRLKKAA